MSVQSEPLAHVPQTPAWQTDAPVPPGPQGVPSARFADFTHLPPASVHSNVPV